MSDGTKIEWTEKTWNPVVGCTRVSAGCDNCYAATMTRRLEAMGNKDYTGLTTAKHFNGVVRALEHKLTQPLKWKKPRRVFVNSMSDLFHPSVPFEFVDKVFAVMALTPQHTYQVLTKRPERMAEYLTACGYGGDVARSAVLATTTSSGRCHSITSGSAHQQKTKRPPTSAFRTCFVVRLPCDSSQPSRCWVRLILTSRIARIATLMMR